MKTKINLYIMCLITFFQSLTFALPVITIFKKSRGLSMSQIFILSSIFMILMLLFEIPWGYISDKIGYKKTLVISYFLFMLSRFILYKAHSFNIFLLETLICSIAISGISGCDSAMIYSSVDENQSEKAFSRYSACTTAGFFISSLLSTIIIKKSMELAVFLTVISYAIAFICSLFLKDIDRTKHDNVTIKESFKNIFNNKNILIFIISAALLGEVWKSIVVVLNQPLYLRSGISLKYFGIISAFMGIVTMVSAKSYKFSERFGQKRILIILQILITISIFALVNTNSAFFSILFIAIIEFSYAICIPFHSDIENKSIVTSNRATMLSIYAMITDLTSAGVNVIIGKISDISLSYGFAICGIVASISTILLLVYYKSKDCVCINTNVRESKTISANEIL
jgi:MFS family permease